MFKRLFVVIVVVMPILQGCTALHSFPNVARSGDTISLSVGSPDNMSRANTTAQLIPDNDPANPVDLPIRSIFRLSPDKTSHTSLYDYNLHLITGMSAHSAWATVVVIDLPTGLTPGQGEVHITTTANYYSAFVGEHNKKQGSSIILTVYQMRNRGQKQGSSIILTVYQMKESI